MRRTLRTTQRERAEHRSWATARALRTMPPVL